HSTSTPFPYTTLFRSAVHAAKPFIVKHHIFLADSPFFTQRSNQLWCTGKQQAKRQFKTGAVIHIQQCNTQPFFWPGLCLPALLRSEEHTSELQSRFDL